MSRNSLKHSTQGLCQVYSVFKENLQGEPINQTSVYLHVKASMTAGKTLSTLIQSNLYIQRTNQYKGKYQEGELTLSQGFCCYLASLLKTENTQLQKSEPRTSLFVQHQ